jgi:hypothetical protein
VLYHPKHECSCIGEKMQYLIKALFVKFVAIWYKYRKPKTKMKFGNTEKKRAALPRLELKFLVSGDIRKQ